MNYNLDKEQFTLEVEDKNYDLDSRNNIALGELNIELTEDTMKLTKINVVYYRGGSNIRFIAESSEINLEDFAKGEKVPIKLAIKRVLSDYESVFPFGGKKISFFKMRHVSKHNSFFKEVYDAIEVGKYKEIDAYVQLIR